MSHPLDGVQAKLDRAYEHARLLKDEVQAFIDSEPYDTVKTVRPDRKRNGMVAEGSLRVLQEPPLKLGLIAGDFAHNLRGSLDHLIYQLAMLGTNGKRAEGTAFPMVKVEADYLRVDSCSGVSPRDRFLAGVIDAHRAIIDAEQPYNAGAREKVERHPLAQLSAFSNRDKHRLINATALRPKQLTVTPIDCTFNWEYTGPKTAEPVADGAQVYSFLVTNPSKSQVRMQIEFMYSVGFGPRGLEPADMRNLVLYVGGVVDKFRPAFA